MWRCSVGWWAQAPWGGDGIPLRGRSPHQRRFPPAGRRVAGCGGAECPPSPLPPLRSHGPHRPGPGVSAAGDQLPGRWALLPAPVPHPSQAPLRARAAGSLRKPACPPTPRCPCTPLLATGGLPYSGTPCTAVPCALPFPSLQRGPWCAQLPGTSPAQSPAHAVPAIRVEEGLQGHLISPLERLQRGFPFCWHVGSMRHPGNGHGLRVGLRGPAVARLRDIPSGHRALRSPPREAQNPAVRPRGAGQEGTEPAGALAHALCSSSLLGSLL